MLLAIYSLSGVPILWWFANQSAFFIILSELVRDLLIHYQRNLVLINLTCGVFSSSFSGDIFMPFSIVSLLSFQRSCWSGSWTGGQAVPRVPGSLDHRQCRRDDWRSGSGGRFRFWTPSNSRSRFRWTFRAGRTGSLICGSSLIRRRWSKQSSYWKTLIWYLA